MTAANEGPRNYTFIKYTRAVLPADGFVFWIKTGVTVKKKGSLHYATEIDQNQEQVSTVNRVVFNSEEEIQELNEVGPSVIFIGKFEDIRFAFSSRDNWYQQAGIYHYLGNALYSDMTTQILDSPLDFNDATIVSNSLPIWLSMNGYADEFGGFGNDITLYPSFLSPLNETPPFATVHIVPGETRSIQAAPRLDSDGTHWQLVRDLVQVTVYGVRNDDALTFQDFVNQFSLDTDQIGIMNMPTIRDEKRNQPELMILAQKKSIEFEVSYYQAAARSIARRLIEEVFVNYLISSNSPVTVGVLSNDSGDIVLTAE